MKTAIYHPQLGNFGGGEYLAMIMAGGLAKSHDVSIVTYSSVEKGDLERFFDINLKDVKIKHLRCLALKLPGMNTLKAKILLKRAISELEKYDLIIDTGTNGWFYRKLKTKTACYVHYPFFFNKKRGIKSILNPFLIDPEKAFKYDVIMCNSHFTKEGLRKYLGRNVEKVRVVYPPVEVEKIKPSKKKVKRIVSVGRFSREKKHEVMIDAFINLEDEIKDFELHLIGAYQEGLPIYDKEYFDMLKEKAKGHRIYIHTNMQHDAVLRFLKESRIYWHARGYGETDPVEYENFGITTVEAMAAGCVPVVINLGAQPEIVKDGESGFCWNTPKELKERTLQLLSDAKLESEMRAKAIREAKKYSAGAFEENIRRVLETIRG